MITVNYHDSDDCQFRIDAETCRSNGRILLKFEQPISEGSGWVTVFISAERLAELHRMIGGALETLKNKEAGK
jgi:hypothetical protein